MIVEEISALPINDIAYEQLCVCSCGQPNAIGCICKQQKQ
jgi:hypothetical protein